MRIISGRFRGWDLTSPSDFRVRPTAEPVRGALLDLVAREVKDARIVDLFAGTGAIGLEAMSRGARGADFVETRPSSLHALRANVAALRLRDQTRIFKRDALQFAGQLAADAYDIAFADPPYGSRMLDRLIERWMAQPFSSILAVEHERGHALPTPALRKTVEETSISLYRRLPGPP